MRHASRVLTGQNSLVYPILYNEGGFEQETDHVARGDTLARVQAAPADIRSDAGYQLDLVQRGETPADFKPMPDVGAGVMEIRLHGDSEFGSSTLPDSKRRSTCCTHSSRRLGQLARRTSNWARRDTPLCWKQGNDEHEIEQQNDDHKG